MIVAPSKQRQTTNGQLASLPPAIGLALTHDFCPWANRYVYWVKHPLVILAIAAAVAALIGVSVAPQGYVVCGALVAIMLLGIVWPWLGTVGLRASICFERRRTREGEHVGCVLTVINRMPWPAWGLVVEGGFGPLQEIDGLTPDAGNRTGVAVALARVSGFSRSDFQWDFDPPCRGEYPLADPKLTSGFPFGLWKGVRSIAVESRILVWPRVVRLDALPLTQGGSWTVGTLSDRRWGYEGDVIGTRAFRPGDMLRHVHWAQTARQGQMIVCERQASLTSSVRVVVDGNAAHHNGTGSHGTMEWTLRIAASICEELLNHDARLTVELGEESLAIEPGPMGQQRLNDALARFQSRRSNSGSGGPRSKASLSPHRVRSRQRNYIDEIEIVVTTNRGAHQWNGVSYSDRRLIVLDTPGERYETSECNDKASAWIELDAGGDVLELLRSRWERLSRDD